MANFTALSNGANGEWKVENEFKSPALLLVLLYWVALGAVVYFVSIAIYNAVFRYCAVILLCGYTIFEGW